MIIVKKNIDCNKLILNWRFTQGRTLSGLTMFFSNNRTLSSFLLPVSPFPFSHFFLFLFLLLFLLSYFLFFLFESDWLLTFARITVSFAFLRNCKKEKNKQKKFAFCFVYLLHFRWRFFSRVRKTFLGFVCLFVCWKSFSITFLFSLVVHCCLQLYLFKRKKPNILFNGFSKVSCKIVERHLKLKIKVRIHQMIF